MKKSNTTSGMASFKDRIPAIILIALLIAIWQIASIAVGKEHIFPAPSDILIRLFELRETLFLKHLPATLETIFLGFGLSLAIGIGLAVLMHVSEVARAGLYPIMVVTQTVPVMCISPLFVLWFGYTVGARLLAVVLSTFFAIALNTFDGFQSADDRKREYMKTCGFGKKAVFLKLEIPSALPKFMTALKMTIPWAVIDAAVAEWLGATEGLGYFSKRMISKMDGAAVFAPVLILCLIALISMGIVTWIDKKYVTFRNEL